MPPKKKKYPKTMNKYELYNLITRVVLAQTQRWWQWVNPLAPSLYHITLPHWLCAHAWLAGCPATRGLLTDGGGAARMALMLRPGVDWAPLKPVTHVAFVWQPSRCKNWGHIPPVSAMCSLSSEHSGWCHSTTTPLPPTPWHLCGHSRPSKSALMKSN